MSYRNILKKRKRIKRDKREMKKYLLLIEDERIWEKFKELINKDINSEIIELIRKRVERDKKDGK